MSQGSADAVMCWMERTVVRRSHEEAWNREINVVCIGEMRIRRHREQLQSV